MQGKLSIPKALKQKEKIEIAFMAFYYMYNEATSLTRKSIAKNELNIVWS